MLWCGAGAVIAGLFTLATDVSNSFAISGLVLLALSVGWTVGPFKTPMAWTEGTLMTYEGNANTDDTRRASSALRLVAVPVYAFVAGLLLLIVGLVA